jgi:predicted ribosomally synthesized peptide with SipW-like signal peptide
MKKFKNVVLIALAMILVFAMGVGGTIAYFTDITGTLTNTVVAGGFATLEIEEPKGDGSTALTNAGGTNQFKIIPGKNPLKDPQVTFTFDSDHDTNAFVFVKITYGSGWKYASNKFTATVGAEGDTLANALQVSVNTTNWVQVATGTDYVVFAYKVDDTTNYITKKSFTDKDVLAMSSSKSIIVSKNLNETQCEWIKANSANFNLDFKAYAIQSEGFAKASDAWAKVSTLG